MGFTIFPYIVALVHTAPYVVLYHHYRRRTFAKVPRHSSFCPFFSQTGAIVRSRFLPSSTHHGRCRPGPLPPSMAGICPFRRNARVTPIMGDNVCSWFVVILAGRGKNTVLLPGRFEGFSPRHNNQTVTASTAANGRWTPVPAQRTRYPYHGQRRLHFVCCDSSWEGKKYITFARAI